MNIVIALMGLPGSGKTSVVKPLRDRMSLSLISRDSIRAAMFEPCAHVDLEKQAAYDALLLSLAACLKLGRSCVIDGMTFSRKADVTGARTIAQEAGAYFLPIFFDCPLEVAQERVRRDALHKTHNAHRSGEEDLVAEVAERFDPPPADVLKVDGTLSPHVLVEHIIEYITQHVPAVEG